MAPEETQGATENKREESNDEDQDEATAREVAERGFKTMEINLSRIEQLLDSDREAQSNLTDEKRDRAKHYAKVGERRVRSVITFVAADAADDTIVAAIKDAAAGKVKGAPKALII